MREKEIDYCRGKHNVLVSIYLFPLLLFLSPCCVNTGEDSASNRHSECEREKMKQIGLSAIMNLIPVERKHITR